MATKVPPPKRQHEAPPVQEQATQNLDKTPPLATETLKFKVMSEFKREYKQLPGNLSRKGFVPRRG